MSLCRAASPSEAPPDNVGTANGSMPQGTADRESVASSLAALVEEFSGALLDILKTKGTYSRTIDIEALRKTLKMPTAGGSK